MERVTGGDTQRGVPLYNSKDEIVYTYEEEDMFKLCKMDFIEPELR
jgi:DNA polymerase/3'-5' exonuclease PolX